MSQTLLVALFSIIFLLLVAGAFLYIYFRSQMNEVLEMWHELLVKLRVRLDKIPNLIETLRTFTTGQEPLIEELIVLRAKTWPLSAGDKKSVHAELDVSEKLRQSFALVKPFPALEKDTNFLALRTEFREIAGEIEQRSEKYNEKVRRYNRQAGFILYMPILRILGFRKLPIFEFEE